MKHIIDKIVDDYKNSCMQYDAASKTNNPKATNAAHDRIINSYLQLKELRAVPALEKLVDGEVDGVRAWAATHLLTVNEALGKKILQEISARPGLLAFDAQMTLSEWEKGSLKLTYDTYKVKW